MRGDALTDIADTFQSTIYGFFLGTAAGSLLGLSFWWSRNYAAMVQPFVICSNRSRSSPWRRSSSLFSAWAWVEGRDCGRAHRRGLDPHHLCRRAAVERDSEQLFYSLGASRLQVFCKLVVPAVLPWTISVLRVNIGLALTGAIVGEFISSQHGLGREILYAGQTYDIALVWVAVLVLSTFSIVMYVAVSWLESRCARALPVEAVTRENTKGGPIRACNLQTCAGDSRRRPCRDDRLRAGESKSLLIAEPVHIGYCRSTSRSTRLFQAAGLDVKFVTMEGGSAHTNAVLSGQAFAFIGGPEHNAFADLGGKQIRAVVNVVDRGNVYLVAATGKGPKDANSRPMPKARCWRRASSAARPIRSRATC